MSSVFGTAYADAYDSLYGEKDYEGECDLVEQTFRRFAKAPVREVLDLGCGTGNHSLLLARRGYTVTGVDRSEEMLRHAREKAAEAGVRVEFRQGDVQHIQLGHSFDAVLLMFAVLGYQVDNASVLRTLRNARTHLRAGGLLAFDIWYGPAVLAQRPGERVKIVEQDGATILRATDGELEPLNHCCRVRYRVWQLREGRVSAETAEEHRMRFFFPRELELFLEQTGFALRSLSAFPELDRLPEESTWNAFVVAVPL